MIIVNSVSVNSKVMIGVIEKTAKINGVIGISPEVIAI